MKKQRKALKNLTIILLSIFIVLFFVFILTFDLTDKSKYENTKTKEETSSYLVDYLNDALTKSSILNILDIDFDDEFIDRAFYLMIADDIKDGIIFKTKNYTIKGYNFSIEDNEITLNLYITYSRVIKYDTKIKIKMEYIETNMAYVLKLNSINIGAFIIPPRIVERVLKNREVGSLGNALAEFLKSIPVGTYDQNTLELSIYKNYLINEIESGVISSLIFKDKKALSTLAATYTETLFSNDLVDLRIKESLNLIIEYSKLVNIDRNNDCFTFDRIKSSKYDILFKEFLGLESTKLSKDYLKAAMMYQIFDENTNDENKYFLSFKTIDYVLSDNRLIISLVTNINNKISIIDYSFIKNGNSYVLNYVEMGKDEGEAESDYFKFSSTSSKQEFLILLRDIGFDTNLITESITISSLLKPISIKNYDLSINNDDITLSFTEDKEIINMIKNTIYSDEFKSSLSSSINDSLKYDSEENLISSFESLSYELKQSYFFALKDFLKGNSVVYNYMNEIY